MSDDIARFKGQQKGIVLQHSPFKDMPVLLPSSLDVGSARAVNFASDDSCTVCLARGDKMIALARANNLVPNSLPAYFFEVKIDEIGTARPFVCVCVCVCVFERATLPNRITRVKPPLVE